VVVKPGERCVICGNPAGQGALMVYIYDIFFLKLKGTYSLNHEKLVSAA
jgi:hypothetical protein